jgi:hypothetical protein
MGRGERTKEREEIRSQINDKWERKGIIPVEDKLIRDGEL